MYICREKCWHEDIVTGNVLKLSHPARIGQPAALNKKRNENELKTSTSMEKIKEFRGYFLSIKANKLIN